MIGPNQKQLIINRMVTKAIPPGGGFEAGLRFLSSNETIKACAKEAIEFVKNAIIAVRQAAEPNPWKQSSDEQIAGELVRLVEEKKAARKRT